MQKDVLRDFDRQTEDKSQTTGVSGQKVVKKSEDQTLKIQAFILQLHLQKVFSWCFAKVKVSANYWSDKVGSFLLK